MIKMYEVRDRKDGYWYSLEQLENMYDHDHLNYSYVHKRLQCPCCDLEILTCTIDEEVASVTSKRSEHAKTCDYYGFKLNQNKVKQLQTVIMTSLKNITELSTDIRKQTKRLDVVELNVVYQKTTYSSLSYSTET